MVMKIGAPRESWRRDDHGNSDVHAVPMPPRIVLPGVPLHITQRGHDRGPTFLAPEDFAFYPWAVREAAVRCAVHAYVLMTNHVHLLLTPTEADAAATFMQSVGRRYVRYFNRRYRRSGTLWEGRYRSMLV
jgi:putative transposase